MGKTDPSILAAESGLGRMHMAFFTFSTHCSFIMFIHDKYKEKTSIFDVKLVKKKKIFVLRRHNSCLSKKTIKDTVPVFLMPCEG